MAETKKIKSSVIEAGIESGIDKRVKTLLEPRIGENAYKITRSLLAGYIKTLIIWAHKKNIEIEE